MTAFKTDQGSDPGKITKQLAKVNKGLEAIEKTQKHYDGYMFRGIEQMMNALNPLFKKYSILVLTNVIEFHREKGKTYEGKELTITIVKVQFSFVADDESFASVTTYGEDQDTKGMSMSQAITDAYKKAVTILFNIATEDITNIEPTPEAKAGTTVPPFNLSAIEQEIKMQIGDADKKWNTNWLVALFKDYQSKYPDVNWEEKAPAAMMFRQYADQIIEARAAEMKRREEAEKENAQ